MLRIHAVHQMIEHIHNNNSNNNNKNKTTTLQEMPVATN